LAGAILAVLVLLTVYDEDVITVEHVLTIMTVLGAVVAGKLVSKSKIFFYSFTLIN
jgi:autophagy-related protein 9